MEDCLVITKNKLLTKQFDKYNYNYKNVLPTIPINTEIGIKEIRGSKRYTV